MAFPANDPNFGAAKLRKVIDQRVSGSGAIECSQSQRPSSDSR